MRTPIDSPWRRVPLAIRSVVRCYINSEQDADIAHAHALCLQYGLDYDQMRRIIRAEMVSYEHQRLVDREDTQSCF